MTSKSRRQVRAEAPDCACGGIQHMTIDEMKTRSVEEKFDGRCPACGRFHLTRAEIQRLEKIKVAGTKEYKKMEAQAMAAKE